MRRLSNFLVHRLYIRTYLCVQEAGGKVAVVGSVHAFSDQFLDKEENGKILVSSFGIGHEHNCPEAKPS